MRRWVWTTVVGGLLVCLPGQAAPSAPPREAPFFLGVIIPQESVDVSPRFDSRLERLEVEVGQPVRAGQVLARLDTRTLRQGLAASEASLQGSRADEEAAARALAAARAKRARDVTPRALALGVYSQEELDQVRYEESTARARLQSARAQRLERRAQAEELKENLEEATLVAPFAGVVASKLVSPGARLAAGQPVLRLLGTEGWKVRFAVPEDAARQLHAGMSLEVKVLPSGLALGGAVESVAPEVDAAARLVFATAVFRQAPPPEVSSGQVVHVQPPPAHARSEAPSSP